MAAEADTGDREGPLLCTYFANGVRRLRKLWVDGGERGAHLRWRVPVGKVDQDLDAADAPAAPEPVPGPGVQAQQEVQDVQRSTTLSRSSDRTPRSTGTRG